MTEWERDRKNKVEWSEEREERGRKGEGRRGREKERGREGKGEKVGKQGKRRVREGGRLIHYFIVMIHIPASSKLYITLILI